MIKKIEVLTDDLHVYFNNETHEIYPNIWLRDHAKDDANWDVRSNQRKTFTANLDFNIKSMASFFEDEKKPKLRPYASVHRTPAIAHKQIDAGGTVGGICVSTLDQAEIFADSGITDILLLNFVITKRKINRLAALSKRICVSVVVESISSLNLLSDEFSSNGMSIDVFLLINSGGDFGCLPGENSINLAQAIDSASSVNFKGIVVSVSKVSLSFLKR